jgi:hypothetical protein
MPKFTYTGDDERDYPGPGDGIHPSFTARPGDTVERDINPDPTHFEEVTEDTTEPTETAEPVEDVTDNASS